MIKLPNLITVGLIMLSSFVLVSSSAISESSAPGPFSKKSDCIIFDDFGSQIFLGSPTPELNALTDELQQVVAAHPTETTGVENCSRYDGAVVFLSNPDGEAAKAVEIVGQHHPNIPIVVTVVSNSFAVLRTLITDVVEDPAVHEMITLIGPDVYTGGLTINVRPSLWPLTESTRTSIERTVYQLAGNQVPIRFGSASPVQPF